MEYRFPIHSYNSSHVLEDPLARHISFLLTCWPKIFSQLFHTALFAVAHLHAAVGSNFPLYYESIQTSGQWPIRWDCTVGYLRGTRAFVCVPGQHISSSYKRIFKICLPSCHFSHVFCWRSAVYVLLPLNVWWSRGLSSHGMCVRWWARHVLKKKRNGWIVAGWAAWRAFVGSRKRYSYGIVKVC